MTKNESPLRLVDRACALEGDRGGEEEGRRDGGQIGRREEEGEAGGRRGSRQGGATEKNGCVCVCGLVIE